MMKRIVLLALVLLSVSVVAHCSFAFNVISPGDPIVAIDLDFTIGSNSPGAEGAANILDGDANTKYLNFGVTNTGFIVTPSMAAAVQSFTLTTANDFPARDPASWVLFGTNDAITSMAHEDGRDENWIQIGMGDLALPDERFTAGDPVGFTNATSYSSYKMTFPTVKAAANSMQVADVGFFTSMDGTGTNLLAPGNFIIPIRDVDPMPSSNSPAAEGPQFGIDRDVNTKYLNFGELNSGFIVTPSAGPTIVNAFQITTANDADARDPASWEIYGTNDAIVTPNNGIGDVENWTLIDSGNIALPLERNTAGNVVSIDNAAGAFTSYRVLFPTVRDMAAANSMQIAEFALFAPDDATLQINRQTGEVVLQAVQDISFNSYEIRSSNTEGLDDTGWTSIASTNSDPDDTWAETSPAGSSASLAEGDTPGGANNGFTLTAGNTYNLGSIWKTLPTSFEDVGVTFTSTAGLPLGIAVEFMGTEIPLGDYSGNGSVGAEDWPMFVAGYGGDYAGMSLAEAYLSGDLDGDFDSDIFDFNLFVNAAGGLGALFGSQSVPEPSALVIAFGLVLVGLGTSRIRSAHKTLPAAVCCMIVAMLASSSAQAQTFTNVGGKPVGITIPAGQQNETLFSGPANLFDDDFLDDPGVIDGELFLLDYNDPDLQGGPFLQYAGLGAAPKTVFFDYGSSVSANWFAYAQRSGGDPTADRVGMFEFWFSNSAFGGVVPTTTPNAVVKLLPTDGRLQDSALRPYSLSGSHAGRYVAMRLTISELSQNQPVSNIGGHEFRLLSGPADVVLQVDRSNGSLTLNNNLAGAQAIGMKSYTVESLSGALDPTAFNGLGGDSGDFPLGNGSGNGWEIGGGSNVSRLAEGYFGGSSTLSAGTSGLLLGNGYNELTLAEDLVFTWTNSDGDIFNARVEYVGAAPDVLPGDYNDNDVVDAADYTVWRDALGTNAVLPNDPTPDFVDQSDYDRWKANFGTAGGLGSLATDSVAVPEPATSAMCALAMMLGWTTWQRRK